VWDLNGNELYNFCKDGAKLRTNDLAISPDGRRLVVLTEHSINIYDFRTYDQLKTWKVDEDKFTSISISQDSRHCLISLNTDKIHLIDIETSDVIQRFEGHEHKEYVIRSAFGGAYQNFVVSGSEDSKIYIWRSNGYVVSIFLSLALAYQHPQLAYRITRSTQGVR
jgi:WD40 repeat protein